MKFTITKSFIAKCIFVLLLLQVSAFKVNGQEGYVAPPNSVFASSHPSSRPDSLRRFYLGLGTGINNYTGILGIGIELRTIDQLLVRGGVGIGSWGTKYTIGALVEMRPGKSGWMFGVSYSGCSGLSNFKTSLMVDSASTTVSRQVNVNLNPAASLNFTASYNWVFHKHNKFFLEFGYAVPLQTNPFTVTDGSVLTSTSVAVLNLTAPGGVIIGVGVMFGL
jgi:hypothetical protein